MKDLFFNKFVKQKKITKFLFNFKKFNVNKLLFYFEFSLFNIIIQSNFLILKKDIFFFIKSGFVFVNGFCIKNKFFQLNIGDRLQILLNKNYYVYLRNFNKLLKHLNNKIKLNIKKNFSKKKDFYKQKTQRTPDWIFKIFFSKQSIPKYLEVDFFTLTSVIIRKSNFYYEYNIIFYKFLSFFNIRLYNWKKLS